MAMFRRRRAIASNIRRSLEVILLVLGLVGGLAIVGSCAAGGTAEFGSRALSAGVGAVVALVLVAVVFLFTTMSRDLRLMRERFADDAPGGNTRPAEDATPRRASDVDI
jgi:hypothetical protein